MPEQQKTSSLRGAVLDNPILVQALGLTPAIIATTSLRAALWVAGLTAIHLIICECAASLWLKKLPDWLRVAVYFTVGIVLAFASGLLLRLNEAADLTVLRAILPLLAASALTAARCERFAIFNNLRSSLRDALANAMGYAAVVILVGFIRESMGHGSLFGHEFVTLRIRAFWMPFGAFLLLGAMAAALKFILQWMSQRGLAVGAEEAMEMAPEDRVERLEKIHRLLQEAERYNEARKRALEDGSPDNQTDGNTDDTTEDPPDDDNPALESYYSPEEKARLNRALEELLDDFEGRPRQ